MITRRADVTSQVTDTDVRASVSQPEVMVKAGQTLTLASPATGLPKPVISWYKNGTRLVAGDYVSFLSDGSLEVRNFVAQDAGTYQSQAASGGKVDSQETEVILAGERMGTS